MTLYNVKFLFVLLIGALMLQAFQCGSPEFTGAKLQMQQKNYKEAIRLLEIEVAKNPGNEEAWFLLGNLKADEEDYEGMNVAFEAALKISPRYQQDIKNVRFNRWGQHLNQGVNYLEQASADSAHYYEKSVEALKKAAAAWPDTALTYKYIGYAYNNKGDFKEAIAYYKKAWEMGKDVEALKRAANLHIHQGSEHKLKFEQENADALKGARNLAEVKQNTRKSDVMRILGAPDNIKKGPRGTKKEDWTYRRYNLVLTIDNDRVTSKTLSAPYTPKIDSSNHKKAMEEFTAAIEALEMAKAEDPKDNETLRLLLRAYVEADRLDEATTTFRQAIVNDPNDKVNRYILGVLLRTKGDYDGAIEQFGEALKIDPEYVDALFDLGATYYNWGVELIRAAEDKGEEPTAFKEKFEKALPYMEKVQTMKKEDATVWETLGTIYARLGLQDKAVKAFDEADKLRKGSNR
ncbi:MAG TPA: tetratricopeptide repeat protein [Bacteroidota bacterium]|nr:tetratricopeptide repeat protein [Bacteroidota bacterium]